jgi:hypothetical protein
MLTALQRVGHLLNEVLDVQEVQATTAEIDCNTASCLLRWTDTVSH